MSNPRNQIQFNLLRAVFQPKWLLNQRHASEQGITLLECLIAIAVMGLTFGLVLPPLLIASASRVQTRRAEQANQLSQRELDRIDALVRRSQHIPGNLPEVVTVTDPAGTPPPLLENVAAPTKTLNVLQTNAASCSGITLYSGQAVPADTALLVDINADCQADFMVQTFRNRGTIGLAEQVGQNRPSEFYVGVRVYSILAGRNATQPLVTPGGTLTGLETKKANLSLTAGQGNQLKRPLAVVYNRFTWSERDGSACAYLEQTQRDQIEGCQNTF